MYIYINTCYPFYIKKRILDKKMKDLGWWKLREGGNHEIWTDSTSTEPIPRHKEINENLARKILKKAGGTK